MPRVLVVEDETVVQLHLSQLVVDLGYDLCGTAADGSEALECAAESLPDLVLMDVQIPGELDGIETAGELATRHGSAIVFVTAHADDETISRIEAAGAAAYVLKPFRQPEIRMALSTALRQRTRLQDAESGARESRFTALAAAGNGSNDDGTDGELALPSHTKHHRRIAAGGRRALLYSHDTLGLGHIRRSLHLAGALLQRDPHLSVLLATGSPVAHGFAVPPRMDYVKLPSVRKVARSRYEPRSLGMLGDGVTELRREILLRTAIDFEPDLLIVDHSPTGMANEMLPALELLTKRRRCLRLFGMRDIIDDPVTLREAWARDRTDAVLERLYDRVLIYGMREIFDPVTAYGMRRQVTAKTHFVGYVAAAESADEEREAWHIDALPRPLVVVTIGGGDGAVEVVECWLEMLSRFRSRVDFWSVVLMGPFVNAELARKFAAAARDLPITLRDFVPSTRPYTRRAELVVCTAGYNTMTEVLAVASRALVIPRILYRNEQLLRAERLADMGLVDLLYPGELDPERLLHAVEAQLASDSAPLREARAAHRLQFDGATRAADLCGAWLGVGCTEGGSSA